jgi:serine phosphatase RsbU (regulator of sigma subunit)/anti-sigma regulatory factor (Ser/Thr protein kinase)
MTVDPFVIMAVLNGLVAAAYLVMAIYLAPRLGLPRPGRLAAVAFFTACGLTHTEMTLHVLSARPDWMISNHMFAIHAVQAVVDWSFIFVALRYMDIRVAKRLPRAGAWEWDRRRDRFLCSEEFARLFGQDAERWAPSLDALVAEIHPEDREEAAAALRGLGAEGDDGELTFRALRAEGEPRVALIHFEVTKRGVEGVAQDITERRLAEEYEREHRIAETLQRSLLPDRLPDLPALDVAARYLPGGAEVGGDWYDVLELPNGHVGLVMGDVVGRGIPAAALVGKLRNALVAYAHEGHGPAETLERLNRLIDGSHDMATVCFADFDPESGRLAWVSAGHPPPLVRRADGTREYLEGGRSVPLGAIRHAGYAADEVQLEPGATVLLYTDGLVERPGVSMISTLDQLLQSASRNGSAEALLDATLTAMLDGERPADDVAVLAAHVRTGSELFNVRLPAHAESLVGLRRRLQRWLGAQGVPPEVVERVTLCVNEACSNAVEHAYGLSDDWFYVTAALSSGTLEVAVQDRGTWRAPRGRDGGRGLMLMRAFADAVDVSAGSAGTTITLSWGLVPATA